MTQPFDVTESQLDLGTGDFGANDSDLEAPVAPVGGPSVGERTRLAFEQRSAPAQALDAVVQLDQLALPLGEATWSTLRPDAPPRPRRIYCNRNLRLDHIQMIGFDMDYTLAIYNQEEMDRLSIEATARKLVECGYPRSLLTMTYQPHFPIRGLLVDKKLGNILKTDRYRYVKRAFHGTRELSSEERKRLYKGKPVRPGNRRYHSIDTLYATSEVAVYGAVVDHMDQSRASVDYTALFDDVRRCIDRAHQDGSIKDEILADLKRFLVYDPDIPPMLHRLRSAGKKLFLLTNSDLEYTEAVMGHVIGAALPEYRSWRHVFDVVVTSARKPSFFTDKLPFGHADGKQRGEVKSFERGRVYTGGCISQFEALTGVGGDEILYAGDHIYGDVLRAKKQTAWRTVMIIQEMADELNALERCAPDLERMGMLEQQRHALLDFERERQRHLKHVQRCIEEQPSIAERFELEAARLRLRRALERARAQLAAVEQEYREVERRVDAAYHPFWGSCFKAGSELSTFGEQVERYACLYTDRVSNFFCYPPSHYFRGPRHRMAHE